MDVSRRVFELQGHRGARGLFPENTLEGFAATIALGVDALELDVALTRDGIPVVFHDVTLSPDIVRGVDGTWLTRADIAVNTLSRDELDAFDVGRSRPGSATALAHAAQVPLDGARIPDLDAVLRLVEGTGVRLDIELKTLPHRPELTASPIEMAERVLDLVDRMNAADRVDFRSFDWRSLLHLRARRPELPLTWLTNGRSEHAPALWWGADFPPDPVKAAAMAMQGEAGSCWAPESGGLSMERVARGHAAGLRVVPWTVNRPEEMARLIGWGVDGICTDRPDLARAAMRAAGFQLPTPISLGGR